MRCWSSKPLVCLLPIRYINLHVLPWGRSIASTLLTILPSHFSRNGTISIGRYLSNPGQTLLKVVDCSGKCPAWTTGSKAGKRAVPLHIPRRPLFVGCMHWNLRQNAHWANRKLDQSQTPVPVNSRLPSKRLACAVAMCRTTISSATVICRQSSR